MGSPNQEEGAGGEGAVATIKRRMFFLIIYGVQNVGTGSQSTPSRNEEEPYVILKATQDCTSETVIRKALSKLPPSTSASTPVHLQLHDYLLLEEVNRGWEPSDRLLPPLQRILDPQERPLEAQAKWRGEGRFILRRIGDDPSSRAWLSSILNSNQKMKVRKVNFSSFFLSLILSCLTCING
jgi:phosphatidylinositol phospholipase C epsilon